MYLCMRRLFSSADLHLFEEEEKAFPVTLSSFLFNKKTVLIKNTNTLGDYPAFFPVCLVKAQTNQCVGKKKKTNHQTILARAVMLNQLNYTKYIIIPLKWLSDQ